MNPTTIWCIGRNYKDHAKEMGAEIPITPLVFIKSAGCIVTDKKIKLPSFSQDIHHELEIAVQLDETFKVSQMALALDLTARDIQSELKKKGQPWAMAKSFIGACPMSSWIPFQNASWFMNLEFSLSVNGKTRQIGKTKDMIFSCEELIQYLKNHYPIRPWDIILTGTPEGVGPLKPNDQLKAEIKDFLHWELEVASS